jgi:hypothetical protein
LRDKGAALARAIQRAAEHAAGRDQNRTVGEARLQTRVRWQFLQESTDCVRDRTLLPDSSRDRLVVLHPARGGECRTARLRCTSFEIPPGIPPSA